MYSYHFTANKECDFDGWPILTYSSTSTQLFISNLQLMFIILNNGEYGDEYCLYTLSGWLINLNNCSINGL